VGKASSGGKVAATAGRRAYKTGEAAPSK
jgi:hypothetical protein